MPFQVVRLRNSAVLLRVWLSVALSVALSFTLAGCGDVTGSIKSIAGSQNASYKISLNTTSLNISEGSAALIWVLQNERRTVPTVVQISLSSPRGDQAADFQSVASTITIPAGEISTSLNLSSADDTVYEGTENFRLSISSLETDMVAEPAELTISMTDNDSPPTLTIANAAATEGNPLIFTVSLSATAAVDVSFVFTAASGGSAVAGTDYTGVSAQSVTIMAGNTSTTVSVSTLGDALSETNETFDAVISSPTNATIATGTAVGTITDDDGAPTLSIAASSGTEAGNIVFTISLSAANGQDVAFTFNANSGGNALVGTDYTGVSNLVLTIPTGSTSVSTTVTTLTDAFDEEDETFTAAISGATNASLGTSSGTGTITDDDALPALSIADNAAAEGSNIVLTVSLNAVSGRAVTFDWATSNGTASSAASDYTAVSTTNATIPAGTTSLTLTIASLQDAIDESNETVNVNLSNPGLATISDNVGIATINDDDAAPTVSIAASSAAEAGNIVFTVSLTAASGQDVTFTFNADSGGTATAGTDYTSVTNQLMTITAGSSSATATVVTLTDALDETNETFTAAISGVANATLGTSSVSGTINDDDSAPVLSVANAAGSEGGNIGFVVSLDAASGQEITYSYASSDGTAVQPGDYTSATGTGTITAGITSTTINVPATDDGADETDETMTLAISAPVNASLGTSSATGTIRDTALFYNFMTGSLPSGITFYRTTAARYFDSNGVMQTAAINTPRFDYDPATRQLRGLLMERPNQNFLTYSDQVDHANWIKSNVTVSANSNGTTAPDGTNSADFITDTAVNTTHFIRQNITVNFNRQMTYSVYAKMPPIGGRPYIQLRMDTGTKYVNAIFNIANGTAVSATTQGTGANAVGKIQPINNGWYRLILSGEFTDATANANVTTYLRSNLGSSTYLGDGSSGAWLWGAQLEATSVESTYVATTTISGSRGGDEVFADNFATWYNSANWTAILDFTRPSYENPVEDLNSNLFGFSIGGDSNNSIYSMHSSGSQKSYGATYVAGVNQGGVGWYTMDTPDRLYQYGLIKSPTGLRAIENGTTTSETANASFPAVDQLTIASGATLHGHIRKFTYRARAVSAANANSLSSDESVRVYLAEVAKVVPESAGVVKLTAKLNRESSSAVTVPVTFTGTAVNGTDYNGSGTTITIAAGAAEGSVSLTISADSIVEPDETIIATMGTPTNATAVAPLAETISILNDDTTLPALSVADASATEAGAIVFTISMNAASGYDVTFTFNANSGGNAISGTDYTAVNNLLGTITAGSTSVTLTVSTLTDAFDEPNETFNAVISGASQATISDNTGVGTILDDDTTPGLSIDDISINEGSVGSFIVTLSASSAQNVTFNYATSAGTATAGADYTSLGSTTATIVAGATTLTLTATTLQDIFDESDETFLVTLSSPTNALISDNIGVGTIVDDDAAPTLSISSSSAAEAGVMTFTIVLSTASAQNVSFVFNANSGGNASAGADYTAVNGLAATITAGSTATSVTVTTLGDATDEGNETFSAVISSPVNATIASGSATGTILDDDDTTAPAVTAVSINDGASYAGSPLVNVKVAITDNHSSGSQLSVRLAMGNTGTGDCQSEYVNNGWTTYTSSTTPISVSITPVDGTKKICAWAKDSAGNVSVISAPTTGSLGVNMDTIEYQTGNPPVVTTLTVTRNSGGTTVTLGDAMTIAWATTDTEGLDNSPISFAYTTDNSVWYDITTNADISNSANMTWVGGLSGNPTSGSGTITTWTAPSSSYFIVRAQSRDIAGNTSVAVTSQPFNTGNWTIYAGTTDRGVGGSGKSAALEIDNSGPSYKVAVHPITRDVFAIDHGYGIKKLDIETGVVSTFLKYGTPNLGTSGTLSSTSGFNIGWTHMIFFDKKGYLYLVDWAATLSSQVYQFNTETGDYRIYLPGGTVVDNTATPSTVNILQFPVAFDEQSSMYFWASCTPSTNNTTVRNSSKRLMKVTQNTDGTPNAVSIVGGNCGTGAPSGGAAATSTNMPAIVWETLIGMTVWENGQKIVIGSMDTSKLYKIVNGILYNSNINIPNGTLGPAYNPVNGKVYVAADDTIQEVTFNYSGSTGDTMTTYIGGGTAAGCQNDGVDRLSACISSDVAPLIDADGHIYISDGAQISQTTNLLVRTLTSDGKIATLFGSRAFYGDGLHRNLIRGSLSGIYYKRSTESNQASFPEGLYFMESKGVVFGHIHPTTGIAQVLWGNQVPSLPVPANGATLSKNQTMGTAYSPAGQAMTFDSSGLPWMRYDMNGLAKINTSNQLVQLTDTDNSGWEWAPSSGTDPGNYSLHVGGGFQNLTLKNGSVFLMGSYVTYDNPVRIMNFDYTGSTFHKVMGSDADYSTLSAGFAADTAVAGGAQNTQLSKDCTISTCAIQYNSALDRIYFAEQSGSSYKLRYITTPSTPATSTLTTVLSPAHSIRNFIFSLDNSQIWIITGSSLYCYDISSGKSWCNGSSTNHYGFSSSLGAFTKGPNQMTWKDANTLLISNYAGKVLQYTLPTGP